jgi:Restriction endonuclease
MAKRKKRSSGPLNLSSEILLIILVVLLIGSGAISFANRFIDSLGFHGLPSFGHNDNSGLILGIIAMVIGLAILGWRRFTGGIGRRWAPKILGIHSIEDIYALSPGQFEQFVAFLFQHSGFEARVVGHTGDEGIDIELRAHGSRIVAQCKRYRDTVGQPTVREFFGSFANIATEGYLVTTGTFSQPARDWAASRPLHLVDGTELLRWTETVAQSIHHHS